MAYATIAEVKEYLGISTSDDDALLGRLISAAQAAIEAYTSRRFEIVNASLTYPIEYWRGDVVFVGDDLRSITSVTTDAGDSWTQAHFTFTPPARVLYFKTDAQKPSADARFFTVTGSWGFTLQPPENVKQACIRLAGHMYRMKDAQAYDVIGMTETGVMRVQGKMPVDVVELLKPYHAYLP